MTDWHSRWESNKIGWHADQVNLQLIEYFSELNLVDGDKIFVPLCGKSLDMLYLLQRGLKVVGVEMSEIATQQFFGENKLEYSVSKVDDLILYEGDRIQIFCGDFFTMKASHLVDVKAVYDRASLIALDEALRQKYVNHLNDIISQDVRVLLLTLNYPQHQRVGPPFAVSKSEVDSLYGGSFQCQELQNINDIENEPMFLLQGVDFVEKAVYCLQKVRM
jgi:thiopurine S-methyltransferase